MSKYKTYDSELMTDEMAYVEWFAPNRDWIIFGKRCVAILERNSRYADVDIIDNGRRYNIHIAPCPTELGLRRMAKKLLKQHEESTDE